MKTRVEATHTYCLAILTVCQEDMYINCDKITNTMTRIDVPIRNQIRSDKLEQIDLQERNIYETPDMSF